MGVSVSLSITIMRAAASAISSVVGATPRSA
jgi:hypothetical protein